MPRPFAPSDPPDRPATWGPATEIGGYRLVRRLGEDEDVVTWIAHGGEETVVLRVFRDSATDARIDAEIGARERLSGPHVPELLDVASSRAGRPVAVVRAVVGPLLSDLLARTEGPLRAGHVTTILAPLAALLDAAHEVGASVGRLDATGIRVDATGAPILVALGAAAIAAPLPERFRDQEPAIRADRSALAALGTSLAALVHERERDAVLAAIAASPEPRSLELALFDCAAPLPMESIPTGWIRPAEPSAEVVTGSATLSAARQDATAADVLALAEGTSVAPSARPAVRHLRPPSRGGRAADAIDRAGTGLGLPAGLLTPVDAALGSLRAGVRARLQAVRSSAGARPALARPRRGVVLTGAAGLLALGAAVLLASAEQPSASSALDALPPATTESSSADSSADSPADSPAEPSAASDLPESLADPAPEEWAPLVGALVDRWIICAPAPAQECVDSVAHTGSGAAEALARAGGVGVSADALAALQEWAGGGRELVVVDRMGAAALVDLLEGETATASLLVVRSEAGWRVRAVMP